MRISLSNLAWDPGFDEEVASLLANHGVDAIDVVPTKYFPALAGATALELRAVRRAWEARCVEIVGMQALLYGTHGLNMFGDAAAQDAMLEHLTHVARVGAALGAKFLVFGSPRNRDRSGIDDAAVEVMARSFFTRLGDVAHQHDVVFCLEPNAAASGANFMTNTLDTAAVVEAVAHPNIAMQLDTGVLTTNAEIPAVAVARSEQLVRHIHASEPGLVPLGEGSTAHPIIAQLIAQHLSNRIVTVEMLCPREPARHALQQIDRALALATATYGPADQGSHGR